MEMYPTEAPYNKLLRAWTVIEAHRSPHSRNYNEETENKDTFLRNIFFGTIIVKVVNRWTESESVSDRKERERERLYMTKGPSCRMPGPPTRVMRGESQQWQ